MKYRKTNLIQLSKEEKRGDEDVMDQVKNYLRRMYWRFRGVWAIKQILNEGSSDRIFDELLFFYFSLTCVCVCVCVKYIFIYINK